MRQKTADITLLCKVVDNFGDIGFVYRLARALSALPDSVRIRIVTDNVAALAGLAPGVDAAAARQEHGGWQIFDWNAPSVCMEAFTAEPPRIVLECFQCGRPDWLDCLLFERTVPNLVHIIMIDYLTAEDYAETFHGLQSLTRSARVPKVNFMPGFTEKTGGLILDEPFLQAPAAPLAADSDFTVLFFCYEKDWSPVVRALQDFSPSNRKVLVAEGAGRASFMEAWKLCGRSFPVQEIPFLPQEEWDRLLCRAQLLFVRGEDSLSRACLCGTPFVWQAYPQSESYQLVKVRALLDRMRGFFAPKEFAVVERCWLSVNGGCVSAAASCSEGGSAGGGSHGGDLYSAVGAFLQAYGRLRSGFQAFSERLKKNGDLAARLMTFMQKNGML
ncbi:MAG: elongation factor P maturation arginine rhamnosyltransferase EarP [Treponemataceae bacterium]|nr:elongation factor P maturation arginine rhamnosyltransferase EarP [Treponemataceae bacterium]